VTSAKACIINLTIISIRYYWRSEATAPLPRCPPFINTSACRTLAMSSPHPPSARLAARRRPYGGQPYAHASTQRSFESQSVHSAQTTDRRVHTRGNDRAGIVQDVARGSIGLGYGPYAVRIRTPTDTSNSTFVVRSWFKSGQSRPGTSHSRADRHLEASASNSTFANGEYSLGEEPRSRRCAAQP
jgi:hypothetical protein